MENEEISKLLNDLDKSGYFFKFFFSYFFQFFLENTCQKTSSQTSLGMDNDKFIGSETFVIPKELNVLDSLLTEEFPIHGPNEAIIQPSQLNILDRQSSLKVCMLFFKRNIIIVRYAISGKIVLKVGLENPLS